MKQHLLCIFATLCLTAACAQGDQAQSGESTQGKKADVTSPKKTYAHFKTSLGEFKVLLYTDKTPATAKNFIDLAQGKKAHMDPATSKMVETPMYDGREIFRVIKGFMFQTGSANDTGAYSAGFNIPDEFPPGLKFDRPGLLAMANAGPGTGSSQFFITFAPTPWLDNRHTIFGEVVEGMDTIRKIENVPVQGSGRERSLPVEKPVIEKVTIVEE